MKRPSDIDFSTLRRRLESAAGRKTWRSLDELADSERFRTLLEVEFPEGASEWVDGIGRREFIKLMGASLALAGIVSCTVQPDEKIVPYTRQPEEAVPGKPRYFASAFVMGGYAKGVLVESHMGRPTKVEGNPDHPGSLGATDALAQASVLSLYDPDRSTAVLKSGEISTWSRCLSDLEELLARQKTTDGAGLRLLTETVTSPTLAEAIGRLLESFPKAEWHQYEPVGRDGAYGGALLAYGEPVGVQYRLDRAKIVLSLDADFLMEGPAAVRHARDFAARRWVDGEEPDMNRLYVVESTPTNTGATADHRFPVSAHRIEGVAREIGSALGLATGSTDAHANDPWISAVAQDLQKHSGESVVMVGDHQPPEVHALGHVLNHALGNVGNTVVYTRPVEAHPVRSSVSLKKLVTEMDAGSVDALVILGGNPAYTAPADLRFADALDRVKTRIHLSSHVDETSRLCHWHIPMAHDLEAWGDACAFDGTATIIQPLIEPLYGGRSAIEVLSVLLGKPGRAGYDIVREFWSRGRPGDFEAFWQQSLHDGVVPGTALPTTRPTLRADAVRTPSRTLAKDGLEIIFRADPSVWDGRFANNGWLQELPKPMTRLTWDNAALVAPATAEALGLQNEQVVEVKADGRSVRAPVWILPGQPRDSVTLHLGYGRRHAGSVGNGRGFDASALRTTDTMGFAAGAQVVPTGDRVPLACTQEHHSMEGRELARMTTVDGYRRDPDFAHHAEHVPPSDMTLYDPDAHASEGYAWGMSIDLNACTGCNACTMACQAENNIPVVGKDEVLNGREMHWIRVDRYFEGDLDDPEVHHQPVPCMQCENAPCEPVCPVAATVHSDEGLNDMVYNRCVGTRYCSNNCPYKVRRFNFLQYVDEDTPVLKLLRNPDVTVRSRGVMEKCTYCVQRINVARIEAKKGDREIEDGDVVTACQSACPARAIVFGNVNDPNSEVSRHKAQRRSYGILEQLNTRPRTTYLACLKNPNPEIAHG